jgi:hypothetical protein
MSSTNSQDSNEIEYVRGNLNGNSTQDKLALQFKLDINALAKESTNTKREYEQFKNALKKASRINVPKPKIYKEIFKDSTMSSPFPSHIKSKSKSRQRMAINESVSNRPLRKNEVHGPILYIHHSNNHKMSQQLDQRQAYVPKYDQVNYQTFQPCKLVKKQDFGTKSPNYQQSSIKYSQNINRINNYNLMAIQNCNNAQNLNYKPYFSNHLFPTSKYSNVHDKEGLIRTKPNYNYHINRQNCFLQPKIVRKHNLIGVEVVDPNAYVKQHESELTNRSQLSNLDITKWLDSNKKLPHVLPCNARLVSNNSQPFNTHLKNVFAYELP